MDRPPGMVHTEVLAPEDDPAAALITTVRLLGAL